MYLIECAIVKRLFIVKEFHHLYYVQDVFRKESVNIYQGPCPLAVFAVESSNKGVPDVF